MASRPWLRRIVRTPPEQWTAADLGHLTSEELGSVAALLGVGLGGRKAEQVTRLLEVRDLRLTLARFGGGDERDHAGQQQAIDALAAAFLGRDLAAMCRVARVYQGRTKRAKAAALIQWRNACRARGEQARREAVDAAKANARPVQLRLDVA